MLYSPRGVPMGVTTRTIYHISPRHIAPGQYYIPSTDSEKHVGERKNFHNAFDTQPIVSMEYLVSPSFHNKLMNRQLRSCEYGVDILLSTATVAHTAPPSNSPLSKRVADWGEDGRAFNYGIVWGRSCAR